MDLELTNQQKAQLSDYVVSEMKRRLISERKLSDDIGLHSSTLQKWRLKKVAVLSSHSQELLGQYRRSQGQTPTDVAKWLNPNPQIAHSNGNSLSDTIRAIALKVDAIDQEVTQRVSEVQGAIAQLISIVESDSAVCHSLFGSMLVSLLELKNCSLEKFAAIAGLLHSDLLSAVTGKPTGDQLEAIARGLNSLYGQMIWDRDALEDIAKRSELIRDPNCQCGN